MKTGLIHFRGLFSIYLGIASSIMLFIGLYQLLTDTGSQSGPVCDILLILGALAISITIFIPSRNPFRSDHYAIWYTIYNLIMSVFTVFTGFQILTVFIVDTTAVKTASTVMCIYNIFYLIFQLGASKHLKAND